MFPDVTISREKIILGVVLIVLFSGLSLGIDLQTYAGEIVKSILSTATLTERWVGLSGSVSGSLDDSAKPFTTVSAGNDEAAEVMEMDFGGQLDFNHYYAAIPYNGGEEFDKSDVRNISLADMDANQLFDEGDFPIFYPDGTSYSALSDSPEETFQNTGELKLLNDTYRGVKADLKTDVPTYVLGYAHESDVQPIFLTPIQEYPNCYDGGSCDYQLMFPNIGGADYHIYMLPEYQAVNINTYIDGENTTVFPYPGRPYRLNVTTRAIFKDDKLVNRSIRVVERSGNSMFIPSVAGDGYKSRAVLNTETLEGTQELLISPTQYSSPASYNLSVRSLSADGEITDIQYMSVRENIISFSDQGPEDKDLGEYSTKYKKGVNRLRPISSCLFKKISNDISFEINIADSSDSNFTLVRGVPYVMNIQDSSVNSYSLEEPRSHLVMNPARSNEFGETTHLNIRDAAYQASDRVVFTPTVPKSEDSGLSADMLDDQGNLLYDVNFSVKGSTCGSADDGQYSSVPLQNSFKKRVNAVRPVLRSLFVAGS
jgi:hypothetical protein